MPSVNIPDLITFISPAIVAFISGWIGRVQWPAWANALVAGVTIVVVSLLCVFVAGVNFSSNLIVDFIIVITYITALVYGPFSPLHGLQKYIIATAAIPPPPAVQAPMEQPTPIILSPQERPVFQPRVTLQEQEEKQEKQKET